MAGEERYDLWRKQGFICRPFSSEIKDGTRFLDDYLEQAQKLEADDDWMEDDVYKYFRNLILNVSGKEAND